MTKKYKKKKVVKRRKTTTKKANAQNIMGALGFLGSGNMFNKLAPVSLTGNKATIINTTPKGGYGAGHEPPAEFASLSDGSKLVLRGPKKGSIIR